jgi:hypothetical protein
MSIREQRKTRTHRVGAQGGGMKPMQSASFDSGQEADAARFHRDDALKLRFAVGRIELPRHLQ